MATSVRLFILAIATLAIAVIAFLVVTS